MSYTDVLPFFVGMITMMMLYVGLQFIILKEKANLYYFSYILSWVMYYIFKSNPAAYIFIGEDSALSLSISIFCRVGFPMLSYIAYYWFGNELINLKTEFPFVWQLFHYAQITLWFYIAFLLIISILHIDLNYTTAFEIVHTIVRVSLAAISIYGIWKVYQKGDIIGSYFVTGSAMLVVFGVIAMTYTFLQSANFEERYFWQAPIFYQLVGIVLELIFFSLALSYKNKQTEIQKLTVEQTLVSEREQRVIESLKATIEKQQAIEQERNRISKDMHDDLGSGLTKISILSEVAKRQKPETLENQLTIISDSARELVDNLNQIIWTLNPENDNLASFVTYIREYIYKYLDTFEINSQFDFPSEISSKDLPEKVRRNLFLVVKESLNNIVKYANASTVLISLSIETNHFVFQIQDNGKGFDFSKTREFGNGLKNMKKRMEEIDGRFEVSSQLHQGTKLKFTTFM